ncbi:SH3 domain-containing protein [Leptospira noumeaensis]|uniref:SH3 domain-containing protein n=1 Tax=Leptospira noumeaensis TaxID=2484964 RepID=A0A4V3JJV5_9LEPT|nr:SH3 domain-containing protein [Leptospira noumeaensis]TGK82084.1 SH3 domain-containing protein [Leptospira noumeaensis]
MRSNPSEKAKTIIFLKNTQNVNLISVATDYLFVDKYFGRWIEIELENGNRGYVFDAFIDYNNDEEKFHKFFSSFYLNTYKNRRSDIERFSKNFKLKSCNPPIDDSENENCTTLDRNTLDLSKLNIIGSDGSGKTNYFPSIFKYKNNIIEVEIDQGGSHYYSWHFKFSNGRWELIYVYSFSC